MHWLMLAFLVAQSVPSELDSAPKGPRLVQKLPPVGLDSYLDSLRCSDYFLSVVDTGTSREPQRYIIYSLVPQKDDPQNSVSVFVVNREDMVVVFDDTKEEPLAELNGSNQVLLQIKNAEFKRSKCLHEKVKFGFVTDP